MRQLRMAGFGAERNVLERGDKGPHYGCERVADRDLVPGAVPRYAATRAAAVNEIGFRDRKTKSMARGIRRNIGLAARRCAARRRLDGILQRRLRPQCAAEFDDSVEEHHQRRYNKAGLDRRRAVPAAQQKGQPPGVKQRHPAPGP